MMNCVACKNPMVVLELNQVEIDYCLSCHGIWLDAGELEALLDNSGEAARLLQATAALAKGEPGRRRCPICRKRMLAANTPAPTPVEIDYCSRNHGLWFDRGELEEVVKFIEGGDTGKILHLLRDMFNRKQSSKG
ncbi:MAG: zf-TFIIB domain-containing protein [candidate division Zixibacteria bacterium]|nr:zf-TFIIB domain-containing protein [candidate division Zixibacteria bacterium]